MANPITTQAQARFEKEGLAVLNHPRMQAAIEDRRRYWLEKLNPSATVRQAFSDYAFEEVVFGAIIWSLNTDAERPEIITISRIAHVLGGERVPGSRWGIDNPDSVYRVIPVDGAGRYIIKGRVSEPRLTENYFTLWNKHRGTVDVLDGKSLLLDAEGRFEISVDSNPKGDRPNHVQSSAEAVEFYIRDVLSDWANERPNELSIERLDGPPQHPEHNFEEKLDGAIAFLTSIIDDTMRWNAQATSKPANQFEAKIDRDTDGALRNQIYLMGNFKLAEDEAMVLDIGLGGASYFNAPITNIWGTTNDIVNRAGSRNLHQCDRNADGSVTLVVTLRDPGIANWLDPCGIPEGLMTLRWAEFATGRPDETYGVRSRVVKLDRLAQALPPETRWVSAEERQAELAARATSYLWRIAE
jgi:hypothetical protein